MKILVDCMEKYEQIYFMDYFNKFPRYFGNPQRAIVENKEKLLELVNRNISYSNTYISLYSMNLQQVDVTRFWLDFDGLGTYEQLRNFVLTYLLPNNYRFSIVFSGGGYHLYFDIEPITLTVTQATNALLKYAKNLQETYSINLDWQAVKDLVTARLVRVIGSYNFKRKHFCVPLTLEEFLENKIPNVQRFNFYFYGSAKIPILEYVDRDESTRQTVSNGNFNLELDVPPLVERLLINKKDVWEKSSGYWDRFVIITTLKCMGFSEKEVEDKLKKHLTPAEAHHSLSVEKQVEYIFRRDGKSGEIFMPTVEWLLQMGYQLDDKDVEFFKNFYLGWNNIWWY